MSSNVDPPNTNVFKPSQLIKSRAIQSLQIRQSVRKILIASIPFRLGSQGIRRCEYKPEYLHDIVEFVNQYVDMYQPKIDRIANHCSRSNVVLEDVVKVLKDLKMNMDSFQRFLEQTGSESFLDNVLSINEKVVIDQNQNDSNNDAIERELVGSFSVLWSDISTDMIDKSYTSSMPSFLPPIPKCDSFGEFPFLKNQRNVKLEKQTVEQQQKLKDFKTKKLEESMRLDNAFKQIYQLNPGKSLLTLDPTKSDKFDNIHQVAISADNNNNTSGTPAQKTYNNPSPQSISGISDSAIRKQAHAKLANIYASNDVWDDEDDREETMLIHKSNQAQVNKKAEMRAQKKAQAEKLKMEKRELRGLAKEARAAIKQIERNAKLAKKKEKAPSPVGDSSSSSSESSAGECSDGDNSDSSESSEDEGFAHINDVLLKTKHKAVVSKPGPVIISRANVDINKDYKTGSLLDKNKISNSMNDSDIHFAFPMSKDVDSSDCEEEIIIEETSASIAASTSASWLPTTSAMSSSSKTLLSPIPSVILSNPSPKTNISTSLVSTSTCKGKPLTVEIRKRKQPSPFNQSSSHIPEGTYVISDVSSSESDSSSDDDDTSSSDSESSSSDKDESKGEEEEEEAQLKAKSKRKFSKVNKSKTNVSKKQRHK